MLWMYLINTIHTFVNTIFSKATHMLYYAYLLYLYTCDIYATKYIREQFNRYFFLVLVMSLNMYIYIFMIYLCIEWYVYINLCVWYYSNISFLTNYIYIMVYIPIIYVIYLSYDKIRQYLIILWKIYFLSMIINLTILV